jgi:hypothetical protein
MALLLVLPALFGLFTSGIAESLLARGLEGQGAARQDSQVERGWFSSALNQRFRLTDGGLAEFLALATGVDSAAELIVSSQMRHGPLPGWTPGLAAADTSYRIVAADGSTHEVPASSSSRVGFTGRTTTELELGAFPRRCRPGRGCLDSGGGRFRSVQPPGDGRWTLTGALGPLALEGPDGRIALGRLSIDARARIEDALPRSGQGLLNFESIAITDPQQNTVTLDSLDVTSELAVAEHRFSQSFSLDAPRIVSASGDEGHVRLSVAARDLDAPTVYGIGRELAGEPPADRPRRVGQLLMAQWQELAVHGPSVTLEELEFAGVPDSASASLHLALPPASGRADRGLLATLYEHLDGRFSVALSEGVIRSISAGNPDQGQRLAALISLGYLEFRDGRYRMSGTYAGRLLTVNGRPLPLPALPGL